MEQSHQGLGAVRARFGRWLELFYEENTDLVFAPVIREFGEARVRRCLTILACSVRRKTEEEFSEQQIRQFLSAMEDEWRYGLVQQFCRQIVECQGLWRLLTEWGASQYRQQLTSLSSSPRPRARPDCRSHFGGRAEVCLRTGVSMTNGQAAVAAQKQASSPEWACSTDRKGK